MGRRGPPVPRLPVRPGRHVARATPTPPSPRPSASRPAPCCTCPTCSAPQPQRDVAATLDRLIDAGPGRVFFCNSGAEANEAAIKLARNWGGRGRYGVVSAYGSFHGRTLATLHATGQPAKHEAFQPLPEGFRHVAWQDLDALAAAIDPTRGGRAARAGPGRGGREPGRGATTSRGSARLCDERGVLLIVDEVQTGLGRTGEWFGFQHYGVRPDVVTVAKALGNGVPIGACWARDDVAAAFVPGDHATTFGGQPLATAAARAVLAVMEAEDVPARARAAGEYLTDALAALPGVESVRGLGLLLARRAGRGERGRPGGGGRPRLPVSSSTPSRRRRCGWPRHCWSPSDEIDEAVAILGRVLMRPQRGRPDAAPARHRRPDAGRAGRS